MSKKKQPKEATIGAGLNPQQELFCIYYTQHRDCIGNGVKSYAAAYDYDLEGADKDDEEWENGKKTERSTYDKMVSVCGSGAHHLLKNPKIETRIRQLFGDMLQDGIVDQKLSEIIVSGKHADAIQAIREYNKLKQRVTEKLDLSSKGERIAGFTFIRNTNDKNNSDDSADA